MLIPLIFFKKQRVCALFWVLNVNIKFFIYMFWLTTKWRKFTRKSSNFACNITQQDEIQSAYFGNSTFSRFSACCYILDHREEFSKRSVAVVSECSGYLLKSWWSGMMGVHLSSGQDLYLSYCHRIAQNFF